MLRGVFVCTGNTCRSPMAADIARRVWSDEKVQIRSAGIHASAGAPASAHAQFVAQDRGGDLGAHRSQPLDPEMLAEADLVLTMTRAHRDAVVAMLSSESTLVSTLADFARADDDIAGNEPADVEDPFGGSLEDYEKTYEQIEFLIERATARLERVRAARTRAAGS